MSFLFWAFLGGTAAVAFPFLFHLIRRTPKGRQDFSATMFLSPSPPRLTRRSRLDHLLLLLLRAAAIVLIALAFMRPFWRSADETLAEPPGRRVALLIDTSASMKRGDLWQQAMAKAEKAIGELEAADDVALYAFDDQFRPIVPFARDAAAKGDVAVERDNKRTIVREKLHELSPGWADTDLGAALVSTAEALAAVADVSEKQSPTASQVIVISDAQEGAKLHALGAFGWPQQVQVDFRTVAAANSSNARPALLEDDPAVLSPGEPKVRVWNSDDSATEEFRVAWTSAKTGAREANAGAAAFYVPPGQSRVLAVPRRDEQADTDRLTLLGDDEPFDNIYYVAPRVQREIRAVGIGRDEADDAQGLRYYLVRALAETPRRKITFDWHSPGGELPDLGVAKPHVVCVIDTLTASEGDSIARYVEGGGLALVVLRDADAAKSVAALVAAKEVTEHDFKKDDGKYAMLGQIEFAHPLFAQFATARYSDFTKIRFWRRRAVTLDEAQSPQIVARFDDGSPAIWERTLGKGRVLVLASGWHPRDSQWALSTKFVPMVSSLFDRAGPRSGSDAALVVHDDVPLPEASTQASQNPNSVDRVVTKPDGAKVVLPRTATTFDATDMPGVYRYASGDESWSFAVNIAPRESDTAPLEPAKLEALGVKLGMHLSQTEQAARDRQLRDTELESRQKIWKWLIVGAVCVLLFETLLAGWRARAPIVPLGEPA
jgi:hypothetical protein